MSLRSLFLSLPFLSSVIDVILKGELYKLRIIVVHEYVFCFPHTNDTHKHAQNKHGRKTHAHIRLHLTEEQKGVSGRRAHAKTKIVAEEFTEV